MIQCSQCRLWGDTATMREGDPWCDACLGRLPASVSAPDWRATFEEAVRAMREKGDTPAFRAVSPDDLPQGFLAAVPVLGGITFYFGPESRSPLCRLGPRTAQPGCAVACLRRINLARASLDLPPLPGDGDGG